MIVRVRLFAAARQLAGAEAIEVDVPQGATVGELRERLAAQWPQLSPLTPHVLFAINSEYADSRTVIPPSGEIACIPPVSGG
jgi:molybdopterin synthase catalytic subunit/molybdopterin synthase sulfur carrier subunit